MYVSTLLLGSRLCISMYNSEEVHSEYLPYAETASGFANKIYNTHIDINKYINSEINQTV